MRSIRFTVNVHIYYIILCSSLKLVFEVRDNTYLGEVDRGPTFVCMSELQLQLQSLVTHTYAFGRGVGGLSLT